MHKVSWHQQRRINQLRGLNNEVHVVFSNEQYCILIVHPNGDWSTLRRIAYSRRANVYYDVKYRQVQGPAAVATGSRQAAPSLPDALPSAQGQANAR